VPVLADPRGALLAFVCSCRITLLAPLALYFIGLGIAALRGPDPAYALQQTFSDAVVFTFTLTAFG